MSDITRLWPPNPGPDQTTTGMKTITGKIHDGHCETLVGLHHSGWWTGVQLKCPDAPDAEFLIHLRSEISEAPFGDPVTWFQKAGEWCPLPWAIPSSFATNMRLYLDIILARDVAEDTSLWVQRNISFHELGVIYKDQYLFADSNGSICALSDDEEPKWGKEYYVIPPLRNYLFEHPDWEDETFHTLLNLVDPVEML